jgi:spoIIIJ-associated protein
VKSVEKEGATTEEAIIRALQTLSVSRGEVAVEVIDEGSAPGEDGGGRPAKVRVTLSPAAQARVVTKEILERMGVKVATRLAETEGGVSIQIETAGTDGLLIGTRGETLAALQHLVQRIMGRILGGRMQVTLDVSGYRARRAEALTKRALVLAERVRATGQDITMDVLSAEDRKTIHQALAGLGDVVTQTIGEEPEKRIVISLRRSAEEISPEG